MKISWKLAAGIVPGLAVSLLLSGCQSDRHTYVELIPSTGGVQLHDPQIWVSDSAVSTWAAQDSSSSPMHVTPGATSMAYWQQGPDPELAAEPQGSCPAIPDYCGELFFVSGGKLSVMNASAPGSTPTPVQIPTQFTAGRVVWDGEGGTFVYVTYPNNSAVGVIGGFTKTEHVGNMIQLPGYSPTAMAMGFSGYRYIISGNPGTQQQLVAFDDSGPFPGLVQNLPGVASNLAANGNYVAVVSGGKLVVYQSYNLDLVGTVSAPSATGWNPNNVVVDQNSNIAYVTSLSSPTLAGQVNAVDLDALAIVGTAAVGKGPFNMQLSWDGSMLFVANQNDGPPGTVSVLSGSSGSLSLLRTITVGTKPGPLAIHP